MDIKVTSQGGQINLNNDVQEINHIPVNMDVETGKTEQDNDEFKKKDLDKAINKLNKFLEDDNVHAEYSVHEKFKTIMIKIIDNTTKEVVMEVPSEKILDMIAKMCEITGVVFDKTV